ncbi:class I SAM-dependent methyltransferase [Methylomagnum sp.]
MKTNHICWVCGANELVIERASSVKEVINVTNFRISDNQYGVTGALYRCKCCEFLECADFSEVQCFYECLEDPVYEEGRVQRGLQARRLLEILRRRKPTGRLVDIGAGSGILVEQAKSLGYDAEGVEPSRWLQQRASELGLNVHLGTFPHPEVNPGYDLVTFVDVIEHVANPVELLRAIAAGIAPDGIGLLVTPDVNSLVARMMGAKWWHFRIAHIGYFNCANLELALNRAGLTQLEVGRPSWYFSADYLVERLNYYLPKPLRLPIFDFMRHITIPLNLGDSLYVVFKKQGYDERLH